MSSIHSLPGLEEPEIHSDLEKMRHSCAHLMAHAISNLFPGAKFGIGPTVENGFYYDVDLSQTLNPEDLNKIEAEMKKIQKENHPFIRKELSIAEAKSFFEKMGQKYKIEIIEDLAARGETKVSLYEEGSFTDLCRGPHVTKTSEIGVFKLQSIAGAFWRGKEGNPQLQRVYGTAFSTKAELDEHLALLEEAKKRDHRKLGKELDLFSFHPEAPASPFFHPKGTVVYNRLVKYIRDLYGPYAYDEIITPQILDVSLWHKSGHYENYRESMYFTKVDEREFAVKPMNCPAATYVYSAKKRSYRDLPLRFADFGRLHRYERSGATIGLTRVRTFCQDDAHIFCTPEQIGSEILKVTEMILKTYKLFEFKDVEIFLSTRPEKRVGSDELWDTTESQLKAALESLGHPYKINPGDGAFYGPKIDFQVADALKRKHQLGTVQLDFTMPERFDLHYTAADNQYPRPVMIHRAVLGSIERFLGVLIEHVGGAFPFWLAPVQARLIPIRDTHADAAHAFAKELKSLGFRVDVDDRNESMGLKTREAQMEKIPYSLALGDREIEKKEFSMRAYGAKTSETLGLEQVKKLFSELEARGTPQ